MPAASGPIHVKPKKLAFKRKPRVVKPPSGDIASSGGDYGKRKAAPTVKHELTVIHRHQHEVRDVKSTKDRARAGNAAAKGIRRLARDVTGTRPHPTLLKNLAAAGLVKSYDGYAAAPKDAVQASVGAPVLKALDQTARLSHAVGGGLSEGPKGFKKGLIENKPYNVGQILKRHGVPGAVAGAAGFAADVALDPTTYVTFGAGSVAKRAALQEAKRVEAKALKAGMSASGAKLVASRAARQVESKPDKGLTVSMAGHEVPGVRRGTASVSSTVKKTPVPKKAKSAAGAVKNAARDVRPQMAPAGVNQGEHEAARQVARKSRASANQSAARVAAEARALQKKIKPDEYAQVIDAIERGKLKGLPDHLYEPARALRDRFRHMKRLRARAGIAEGTTEHYFPHVLDTPLKEGEGVHTSSGSKVRPDSSKTRTDRRTIAAINPERAAKGEDVFSTNAPLVFANYGTDTARAVAHGTLVQDLADLGRSVKAGDDLKAGEQLFWVGHADKKFGLHPVDSISGRRKGGRYVAIDKQVVESALKSSKPAQSGSALGRGYDRTTAGFKRIATFTPGFHARNFIGDTQMAYLSQPGHRLLGNAGQAGKALKRLSQTERTHGKLTVPKESSSTIKVAKKDIPVDEFLRGAQEHGVIRSGYIGRELKDLQGQTEAKGIKRIRKQGGRTVQRWMQNREDLMRLATYKHGLDTGLSPAKAADLSLETHIDYGDLTDFERKYGRRLAPFYTFSARAIPLHAKRIVQKPGKFATIEKAREEVATATGLDERSQRKNNREYQNRQAPFVAKIGGKNFVIGAGLPITSLNEVPDPTQPLKYPAEIGQFAASMANPLIKDPVELGLNRSFFFRSDIENPSAPLVAAPKWVKVIYEHDPKAAKALGIVPDYVDKRTGKKTWGWRGKADYMSRVIPGAPAYLQGLASGGTNRRGQNQAQKALAFIGGVRVDPQDPVAAQIDALYKTSNSISKKLRAMNQRGINKDHPTREYTKTLAAQKTVDRTIHDLSVKRGDVIPLKRTAGAKKGPLTPTQKIQREIKDAVAPDAISKQIEREIKAAKAGG